MKLWTDYYTSVFFGVLGVSRKRANSNYSAIRSARLSANERFVTFSMWESMPAKFQNDLFSPLHFSVDRIFVLLMPPRLAGGVGEPSRHPYTINYPFIFISIIRSEGEAAGLVSSRQQVKRERENATAPALQDSLRIVLPSPPRSTSVARNRVPPSGRFRVGRGFDIRRQIRGIGLVPGRLPAPRCAGVRVRRRRRRRRRQRQ